jgi:hypothetical protein
MPHSSASVRCGPHARGDRAANKQAARGIGRRGLRAHLARLASVRHDQTHLGRGDGRLQASGGGFAMKSTNSSHSIVPFPSVSILCATHPLCYVAQRRLTIPVRPTRTRTHRTREQPGMRCHGACASAGVCRAQSVRCHKTHRLKRVSSMSGGVERNLDMTSTNCGRVRRLFGKLHSTTLHPGTPPASYAPTEA